MLTTVADIREIEKRTHSAETVAEFRAPAGGAWIPLQTDLTSGTVSFNDLNIFPGRTCRFKCMTVGADGSKPFDQGLSTLGGWVRLFHQITRLDQSVVRVPLGVFRIQTLTIEPLTGAVTIDGSDAGITINDYGLVLLQQGELAAGAVMRTFLDGLVSTGMTNIPRWWGPQTAPFDPSVLPATTSPVRVQYTGTRVEAVKNVLTTLNFGMDMPTDGGYVFRAKTFATAASPVTFTLTPGDLGNLDTLSSVVSRSGVYNIAVVNYTPPGTSDQRRVARQYTVAGSPIAIPGPFGYASVEASGENIADDAAAYARADAKLAETVQQARVLRVSCSPIYGVECNDVVNVVGRNGSVAKGRVTGGSIPFNVESGWVLDIAAFDPGTNVEAWMR